jgi:hypothetical protein
MLRRELYHQPTGDDAAHLPQANRKELLTRLKLSTRHSQG